MEQQYCVFCDTCRAHISADQYESHMTGKRHKMQEERLAQTKNIQDTGLYIQGAPVGVTVAEVGATFGRFGCISKVEIYGSKAYVNYTDRNSCEEAIKHHHVIRNQTLTVAKRTIHDHGHVPVQNKRSHDATKNQPKGGTAQNQEGKSGKAATGKPGIDNAAVLTALRSSSTPISEQIATLKRLILAGDDRCKTILNTVCNDIVKVMKSSFTVCDLFSFGSMTSGLAFKDSDLDVFAHLEFNKSTHFIPGDDASKKTFAVAKKCFYRRSDLFTNVVPIPRAKIPIMKIVHVQTKVACDVSFKDAMGYYNSSLLRHYIRMNEKFFDLMVFIKYWGRVHSFCNSSRLSNYSLCLLGISFFLSLKDADGNKLVPTVQDLLKTAETSSCLHVEEWNCAFDDTPITITFPESPEFSLIGLLKSFFEYIARLPFNTHVVSVLTGDLISREIFEKRPQDLPDAFEVYKKHISKHPEAVLSKPDHFAVIHDPFKLNHNLLDRVNLVTMQAFIQACKTAAEDIAVAMNSNMELSLFYRLLDAGPTNKKIAPSKQDSVSIIMDSQFVQTKNLSGGVKGLLIRIFEKILLFKVTIEEDVNQMERKEKVCKTDNMLDVQDDHHFKIVCEGLKGVWSGRKKAKQTLNLNYPLSFNDEESISRRLEQTDAGLRLKLKCEVSFKDGKWHMDFEDMLGAKGGNFNACTTFLKNQLPKWINSYSSEKSVLAK